MSRMSCLQPHSNAIVLGFNVRPVAKARDLAEKEQIDVRLYNVIYQAIDDVKKAMEGLLEPLLKEVLIGQAQVLALFSLPKGGTVAGCRVTNGKNYPEFHCACDP